VDPPPVSSSSAAELHVIGVPARGHRNLGADGAGGSCGSARGAKLGGGWPWGTMDYELRGALARPAASGGTVAALRSAIAVEHDFVALRWRAF
jgi:hypothetical protein